MTKKGSAHPSFDRFLLQNPNWANIKGSRDTVIKRRFIAYARIEYNDYIAKLLK